MRNRLYASQLVKLRYNLTPSKTEIEAVEGWLEEIKKGDDLYHRLLSYWDAEIARSYVLRGEPYHYPNDNRMNDINNEIQNDSTSIEETARRAETDSMFWGFLAKASSPQVRALIAEFEYTPQKVLAYMARKEQTPAEEEVGDAYYYGIRSALALNTNMPPIGLYDLVNSEIARMQGRIDIWHDNLSSLKSKYSSAWANGNTEQAEEKEQQLKKLQSLISTRFSSGSMHVIGALFKKNISRIPPSSLRQLETFSNRYPWLRLGEWGDEGYTLDAKLGGRVGMSEENAEFEGINLLANSEKILAMGEVETKRLAMISALQGEIVERYLPLARIDPEELRQLLLNHGLVAPRTAVDDIDNAIGIMSKIELPSNNAKPSGMAGSTGESKPKVSLLSSAGAVFDPNTAVEQILYAMGFNLNYNDKTVWGSETSMVPRPEKLTELLRQERGALQKELKYRNRGGRSNE